MTVPADLDRRFRDTAARSGMLDASYDVIESELGPLLAAVTDRGLARITFDPEPERELEALSRMAGPRVMRAPRALDDTRRELDDYFAGKRTAFDLALDLRGITGFTLNVLNELAKIPLRPDRDVRRARRARREPAGLACRRHGDEPQPDPDRAPVPPHRRRIGPARRVRRRPRAQGAPASARRCPARLGNSIQEA